VAAEYPLQSAWWINHFKYFKCSVGEASASKREKFAENIVKQAIKNITGAESIICKGEDIQKIVSDDGLSSLIDGTGLFMKELIEFAKKQTNSDPNTWKVPKQLVKFDYKRNKILMPINLNMQPNLPEKD